MVDATHEDLSRGGGSLAARNVSKTFLDSSGAAIQALHELSLDVGAGEFVSILGPSGCGKSTLLRLAAGLDNATEGRLTLDGETIEEPHYLRGLVFQDPTLFPWLTVRRNIAVGLDARGLLKTKNGEVERFMKLVGLDGFETAYPHQLSGGMAQRAALARALINDPKVLLLDEPLGALDAFTRMSMQDEILRIWHERETTVLLVTHDIDEAIYLSDRIVIMTPRPGRVHESFEVALSRPRNRAGADFLHLRARILGLLHFAHDTPLSYYL